MKTRHLVMSEIEEIEFHDMLEEGVLEPLASEHSITYREAFFMYKGKLLPGFENLEITPLDRWL